MLNKAVYRLRKDGKSDHASWWVFPVVWCRWWIVWDPERIPVAHNTSAHGAQMYISWYELFECGQLNKIGTRSKHFLWMPNDDSSMWSKQWWSVVSNAALRSRRTTIAPPWVSTACRRSFWTHNRAVLVLCSWRYADWYTSYRSFIFRWSTSCTHTMRSISLDRKERLETSRKFYKISQSSMAFFMSGKWRLSSVLGRNQQIPEKCWQWAWAQVLAHLNKA